MDRGNRRDFIKASAAIGLIAGASDASAQPAQPQPGQQFLAGRNNPLKIGFLHSSNLESALEEQFLLGLRNSNKFEGDPKQPIDDTKITRVKIKKNP